ncbi:MAG: YigZ family protein [Lachnospiraceae bacterium]|nr:YigZ family protein [Lachnospiraceae bacterium]
MGLNDTYNIISESSSSEIVVTKSRFIGYLSPASSAAEAEEIITRIRKKYNDARHNCWAYIVMTDSGIVSKCSDDGEPSGTAGKPMMAVLEGADLVNVVCVVTRYFGGVLLGTGGLVRAYTDATAQALDAASVSPIRQGKNISLACDYQDEGGIRRLLENEEFAIRDTEYTDKVKLFVLGPSEKAEALMKRIVDMTGGRASCEAGESEYY